MNAPTSPAAQFAPPRPVGGTPYSLDTLVLMAAVFVIAALAAVMAIGDLASPLRPAVALLFLLTCPGLPLAHALALPDRLAEVSIGVAVSLAVNTIVVGGLLFAGVTATVPVFTVLLCITLVAAVFGLRVRETGGPEGTQRS